MKSYKTSKDYKRLKELLDKGYDVIVIDVTDNSPYIARKGKQYYWFRNSIMPLYLLVKDFVDVCSTSNIEFIEPTEE